MAKKKKTESIVVDDMEESLVSKEPVKPSPPKESPKKREAAPIYTFEQKEKVEEPITDPFKFFNEIWYVNLDIRSDRKEHIEKEMDKVGIKGRLIRFPALGLRWIGNALGHLEIIKQAREKGLQNVLIFEDDFKWVAKDPIDLLDRALMQLPNDWDCLYFGPNLFEPPTKVSENLIQIHRANSTVGIVIRNSIFTPFIKAMEDLNCYSNDRDYSGSPVCLDNIMNKYIQSNFKCLAINPIIGTQAALFSHIGFITPEVTDGYGAYDIVNNFNRNVKLMGK